MGSFPRWSGLKHFNAVTTTHFTDGQAFYDILKVFTDFLTIQLIIKFMALVHSAMCGGFSSERLSPSTLHSCLSPFSNTCWPPMHDGK